MATNAEYQRAFRERRDRELRELRSASEYRGRPSDSLIRLVCADAFNVAIGEGDIARVAARMWPSDPAVPLLIKGATTPAVLAANPLAASAVADFIAGLGPVSAGAALLSRGLQFRFDGSGAIQAPGAISSASGAAFFSEGTPIAVEQLSLSGPTLVPRKIATTSVFTGELFRRSTPNVELFVREVLTASVGHRLDSAMFDAAAGDASRPAGLLNSISATAASAASPDYDAMTEDLSVLAGAVSAVAGSSPIVFVASPRQAAAIRIRQPNLNYEVLASSALAAGVVIAIATNAIVSAADPVPRVDTANSSVVVFDDTAPAQLGTVGAPNVAGAPAKSLFQSDLLSIRLILEVSWALRAAGGLAWTQTVVW